MTSLITTQVHISTIRAGDTIQHDGKVVTVCGKDIKRCNFMGITIFGDSYALGHRPVTKVVGGL